MRVLLIVNTLPPHDLSGVGEQVLQLAAELRRRGHEVEVLGRGPGGALGPKLLFPLLVVPAALRRFWRFRPEVVQVHESDGAFAALGLVLVRRWLRPRPRLAALLQVSYVEELRAVRPLRDGRQVLGRPGFRERRFRWFKGLLQVVLGVTTAQLADVLLAPSAATAAEVERDYRVSGVSVMYNTTGGLMPLGDAVVQGPQPEPGFLLFVGRLRLRKGVEVLLAALEQVRRRQPGARLLIAGDGEHRRRLEHSREARRLGGAVTFLGRCDAARVRRLFAGARALVVPSIYEGLPLVVLEAMDAGLPVIASRVSGIPEAVVDGETGWLVPAENVAALTAALEAALADGDEARRRGAAGRRRLEERFRPQHAAEQWERILTA